MPVILAEPSHDPRQVLGRQGEASAEALLERAGLKIVARRFRRRWGEIDLIGERDDLVVFVEVKTRRGTGFGTPAEAVTRSKQERMARVALAWLQRTGGLERRTRFDVVEVYVGAGGVPVLHHIEDAFRLDRDP
jgi:putative endonuclease